MSLAIQSGALLVGENVLLRQIDFGLDPGEVVSVIGPNGAGKTSLLQVLCSEKSLTSGIRTFEGQQALKLDDQSRRIAVLPQQSVLDFPFKVAEVVMMGRIPHHTSRPANEAIASDVMARMQLTGLANRIYTSLSGGERQRVQIARVLCQLWDCRSRAFFLFDEPTAPLDLAHQVLFLELVQELAARGSGVLLVMHDINLASRFSDRIVLLQNGCVVAAGAPVEVMTVEHLESAYGVGVAINLDRDGAPFVQVRRRQVP